ncbi:putative nuclease HARBI1 [Anopheles bellator]|uniref:putative nuclease HARBI1 n=1 Tax=Anopheles bellator TaxID=139047 RepID=UPI002648130F|nr:putative nuclease HARBI1 [Anopheles bellator]XP_058059241.1 putative nuclease HARBI1 [Anopheles bellator]
MDDDTNESEGQLCVQHEQQQQAIIKYEYTDYDERDVVYENDQEQDSLDDYDEQHENASVTFPLELKEHDTLHERNGSFSNTTENVETSTVDTNETPKAKGQMQSTARKTSHEATMSNTKHFMIVRLPSGTALRRQCTAHKSSYIDNVVVNYSETDFLENFRIGRKTVHKICQHLAKIGCFQQAKGHGGYAAIGVETNVLAFLWFMGQEKAHYRDVAERFDLSLSCLHDVIWRMCDALLLLKPTVFVRPNENRKQMLVDHFAKLCAIPGVIGIVDGTHIRIDKPSENPNTYLVQKRYYSLQLQAIFDENKQFIDVFVDYPGEPDLLTAVRELCTDQYCILGSDAYPCIPQLLVPYRGVAKPLTEGQVMFNAQLAAVQKVYENTFTMVKQRFRQLYHLKSRQLSNVVKLIKVCCILHNLAPQEEMALLGRDNTQQKMPFSDAGFVFTYASESEAKLELGKQKREQICAYLQADTSR